MLSGSQQRLRLDMIMNGRPRGPRVLVRDDTIVRVGASGLCSRIGKMRTRLLFWFSRRSMVTVELRLHECSLQ